MIPQIGFVEMLLIAVLALIVVGPKDLPVMMQKAGQFFGKMKQMGQEFKDAFNQIGQDDELAQLREEIDELKSLGKLSNLSDEAFAEDMRELDKSLEEGVEYKAETAKPAAPKSTSKPKPKKPKTKSKKPKKKSGDDG